MISGGRRKAALLGDAMEAVIAAVYLDAGMEGMGPPVYADLSRAGPDHAPVFRVEVRLADGRMAQAEAASKRAAQQLAADALLAALEGGA